MPCSWSGYTHMAYLTCMAYLTRSIWTWRGSSIGNTCHEAPRFLIVTLLWKLLWQCVWFWFILEYSYPYDTIFPTYIAPGKKVFQVLFFSYFSMKNLCCGYSLEGPQWGASIEYLQHMFLWRNKKNINSFWLKKKCLIWSYEDISRKVC